MFNEGPENTSTLSRLTSPSNTVPNKSLLFFLVLSHTKCIIKFVPPHNGEEYSGKPNVVPRTISNSYHYQSTNSEWSL